MTSEGSSSLKEELSDSDGKPVSRNPSEASIYTEDDESSSVLNDDESLRKWKEQLLGGVDVNAIDDDDKKCYLEINYTFDIQKEWAKS
ncbi:hypothetical protein SASPL_132884 [Salvia splendens]|uniref:Uncharacterized protein n=1 Tax=Salvia splendens TaxID=180675 RepID=A0A8X8ZHJ8_SALSN|nr:hypothetical protein SASPL_132884 [Salvia splendens]